MFRTEVVLPPEMVFPTLQVEHYKEGASEEGLRYNLDQLEEQRARTYLQHKGRATSHGQPPCRIGRLRPCCSQGPIQGGATGCGQDQLAREASSQQGQRLRAEDARKWLSPVASPTTSRGGRPLAERLPMGKGSCRLHRGSGDGAEGARGLEVTLSELLNMLREAKSTIKKEKLVLYIGKTNKKRKASKTPEKGKGKGRPGKTKVAKKDLTKDKR
ncbi:hypothetical protein GW17_00037608 [Ensete ventricosum]|nr:hypothetical protein GW17_00037608 [Ensete ventricosum]